MKTRLRHVLDRLLERITPGLGDMALDWDASDVLADLQYGRD